MLQRLQSIYLFLVTAFGVAMLALPFVNTEAMTTNSILKDGIFNAVDNYIIFGLLAAVTFVAFVNIFLFKKRKVQIVINRILFLLSLGALGYMGYFIATFFMANINIKWQPAIFCIVGILLFLLMATGRIKKDEKLVKSMDNLR